MICKLIWDKSLRDYLFERNGIKIYLENIESDIVPHYEAIVGAICIGERTILDENINIEAWIENYMANKTGGTDLEGDTAFNIICELFIIMHQFQKAKNDNEILPAYRDLKKAALLGNVDAECSYVKVLLDHNYINEALDLVIDMDSRITNNEEFELVRNQVIDAYAKGNNS